MKNRILIIILAITLGVSSLFAESGTCGDNLTWTLEDGVLTISGYGEMEDYDNSSPDLAPWEKYKHDIKKIIISKGVTSIGNYAFFDQSCGYDVLSVSISNSVKNIGYAAFYGCFSRYGSPIKSITIPNSVTTIGNFAFYGCHGLTSISIPNSVTDIGGGVFMQCTNLTSVTIPNSVTHIGDGAFYYCYSLTSVTIPNSVTSIGDEAFLNCGKLKSVLIPNSVTSIGDRAFEHCSNLTSVTIPNSVISIGDEAFLNCESLVSINVAVDNLNYCSDQGVLFDKNKTTLIKYPSDKSGDSYTIPNGVTNIGDEAFVYCRDLDSVTIPNSVISIGNEAFSACENLYFVTIGNNVTNIGNYAFWGCAIDSVIIPSSVTSIGEFAFSGCETLTSIEIPNSVTSIGKGVFSFCRRLISVTIPNSVTSIGDSAFINCRRMSSIEIPNSVTNIGEDAFEYCKSLVSINVAVDNLNYCSADGVLYDKNKTILIKYPEGKYGSYIIPSSVTSIRDGAFNDCKSLKSITIPNSVTSIGAYAFNDCKSLKSITIPSSVTSIGKGAFFGCDSLPVIDNIRYADTYLVKSVNESLSQCSIREGTKWIGAYAFSDCKSLKSITIPNSVTSIRNGAFDDCKSLKSISIPNSVTSIGAYAFNDCKSLKSITIPSSVTSIGEGAFWNCENLPIIDNLRYADTYLVGVADKSLSTYSIKEGTKWIGDRAFKDCKSLKSITIPNSVTSIGEGAFENCYKIASIEIPNSVTSIGKEAFSGCYHLKSIGIPNSVTSIGDRAFYWCSGLTSINVAAGNLYYCSDQGVLFDKNKTTLIKYPSDKSGDSYTIPNGVTNIGDEAFLNCKSLKSITISNSVTSIGNNAFFDCKSLKSITIPSSVTSIGEGAFSDCKSLKSITIPNSVTSIGKYAFWYCKSLKSITIPNSVTSIGKYAFLGCDSLHEFHYPEGLDLSNASIPSSTKLITYDPKDPPVPRQNPPLLALVDEVIFTDATGNNRIDTNEKCAIRFKVQNNGKGDAENCEARVTLSGTTSGISVQTVKLPTIAVGDTFEIEIPITSDINTQDGQVTFSIEVYEPWGWGIPPFPMSVTTKAYDPPFLQVVDYATDSKSGKIGKVDPFSIAFKLQNTAYGDAEDVKVKIKIPANVSLLVGESELSYPVIKSGEEKDVKITIAVSLKYPSDNIPVIIDIQEKHGKYAENKTLNIALNQTTTGPGIIIAPKPGSDSNRGPIQIGTMSSDIDRDIPETGIRNDNTFVLIIANEHYNYVEGVPYAINDGKIFREYCIKTLGINENQILYIQDATGGMIREHLSLLGEMTTAFALTTHPHIIVYYAGHGIPDESSMAAYLLPVDVSSPAAGFKLDNLYTTLGMMPASQITVFMDACFSGSKRDEGMLASARYIALKAKSGVPQGKMVVFSAAQGDETAYPNKEQQHGMFTYYLLKKLKETEGNISLKELGDYVTTQVRQQSILINRKTQTPCVTASAEVAQEWQTWKLK